jgi:hypothetical protein
VSGSAEPPRVRAVPWIPAPGERVERAVQGLPAYLRRARALERTLERLEVRVADRYERRLRAVELHRRRLARAGPSGSSRRRAEAALRAAEQAFDRRWRRWLERELDLRAVNEEIERFNRCFPIERQCALRHVPPDALAFRPRPAVTVVGLLARHPTLS